MAPNIWARRWESSFAHNTRSNLSGRSKEQKGNGDLLGVQGKRDLLFYVLLAEPTRFLTLEHVNLRTHKCRVLLDMKDIVVVKGGWIVVTNNQ